MLRSLLLILMVIGAGCRPKTPAPAASAAAGVPPAIPAAVLLSEDQLDVLGSDADGTGAALYRSQVDGLASSLRRNRINAETLVVAPAGVEPLELAGWGAVFIVDTPVIRPETWTGLVAFVEQGGVLVAVGEVGTAVDPAAWSRLFGLTREPGDMEQGPAGAFQWAGLSESGSSLLAGLNQRVDWGPNARHRVRVRAAGATVLAAYADEQPALTEHRVGAGRAYYLAVLPNGRTFGGWEQPGDTFTVLTRLAQLGTNVAPRMPRPLRVAVDVNRMGYPVGWPRTAVVRVQGGDPNRRLTGRYEVRDARNQLVTQGSLLSWTGALWRSRLAVASLQEVNAPGTYQLAVKLEEEGVASTTNFNLLPSGMLTERLRQVLERYLEGIRCGEACHADAPVTGGAHAAVDDATVRLEDMLQLTHALTLAVERFPQDDRLRYELERAVMWCWRMRGPDGMPAAAVQPVGGARSGVPAAQDVRPRELLKTNSVALAARYAAVMARATKTVRNQISQNLGQEIAVAAEQAYLRIRKEPLTATADLGDRLWAAVEVHAISYQAEYLEEARRDAARLYSRQLDRDQVPGTAVYGDFFVDGERVYLTPLAYERDTRPGLYYGLLALFRLTPEGTVRDDLRSVLDRFTTGFLVNSSAANPYGRFATAVVPAGPLRPRPGNRGGVEPPERFQLRWFGPHGGPGLNASQLTLAAVALEWARETGQADLEQAALQQVNGLLGFNPLGLDQVGAENAVPRGFVGRADYPVWAAESEGRGAIAPNAALLSVLARLPDDQR